MKFLVFTGVGTHGKSLFSSPQRFIELMTGQDPDLVRISYEAAPKDLKRQLRPFLPQLLNGAVN